MKAPIDLQTRPVQISIGVSFWWAEVDSNHRSRRRQIYSLIHLAALESAHIQFVFVSSWSRWLESNPQPADYKSAALPIELHRRVFQGLRLVFQPRLLRNHFGWCLIGAKLAKSLQELRSWPTSCFNLHYYFHSLARTTVTAMFLATSQGA